jgi:hypothetical protein
MQVDVMVFRVRHQIVEQPNVGDRRAPVIVIAESGIAVEIRSRLERDGAVFVGAGVVDVQTDELCLARKTVIDIAQHGGRGHASVLVAQGE